LRLHGIYVEAHPPCGKEPMNLFKSRKRTAAAAEALAQRIQPPAPAGPQPAGDPQAVRAASEFGTGLRTRIGGSDPGCWTR
jgi:hypothetical protein